MPRGGKRAGAGRPRGSTKLTYDQELWVGAWCETFWRRIWRLQKPRFLRRVKRKGRKSGGEEDWELAEFKPVSEELENFRQRNRDSSDYLDDFDSELRIVHRVDENYDGRDETLLPTPSADTETPNTFYIARTKPQSAQSEIRLRAQRMILRRYRVRISPSKVKKIWHAFREVEKGLRD